MAPPFHCYIKVKIFFISETPYTVNLCIRKRFTRDFDPLNTLNIPNILMKDSVKAGALLEENKELKCALGIKEDKIESLEDTVAILEEKVAKSESDLFKHFEKAKALGKEIEDKNLLKDVIKKLKNEATKLGSDLKAANKAAKVKEKEIYNVENKFLNQKEVSSRLKEDINALKIEKSKADKEMKKLTKRIENDQKDRNHNSKLAVKVKSEVKFEDHLKLEDSNPFSAQISTESTLVSPGSSCTPAASSIETLASESSTAPLSASVSPLSTKLGSLPAPPPTSSAPPLTFSDQCFHNPQCLERQPYQPRSSEETPLIFKFFNFVRYNPNRRWKDD